MANPKLLPIANCAITDVQNEFGFQEQPGANSTDRLSDLGFSNSYEHNHIRYDAISSVLHAEPFFVPWHNLRTKKDLVGYIIDEDFSDLTPMEYDDEVLADGMPEYPVLRWDLNEKSYGSDLYTCGLYPLEYMTMKAVQTRGKEQEQLLSISTSATLIGDPDDDIALKARGFYIFKRHSLGNDTASATDNRTLDFVFYLSDTHYYTLRYRGGHETRIIEDKDGRTKDVGSVPTSQSMSEAVGGEEWDRKTHNYLPYAKAGQTAAIVQLMNGILQVTLHGQTTPICIYVGQDVENYFSKVEVNITGGKYCFFSVHPMCYHADAYFTSNEHEIGFVRNSATPITYKVGLVNTATDCDAGCVTDWEQGSQFRYKLSLTNNIEGTYKDFDYAFDTPLVRQITWRVAPITTKRADMVWTPNIRQATVTHRFDISNLTIQSSANVVFNNRHGEWKDGWPYDGGGGNRAIGIEAGWVDLTTSYSLVGRRFTGISNTKSYVVNRAPESTVAVSCRDLGMLPQTVPMISPPWMDGWCHLYAMRYILWLSGVTDASMDFEYCGDPFCTNPQHYHLPTGEGGRPQMYFAPGTMGWAAMLRIRELTGHVMYFDAFGKFHYYPWNRLSPGPQKRLFFEQSGSTLYNIYQLATQMSYTESTESVRSGATVIGVDAYGPHWRPVVAHQANNDAINNKYARNYKGFRCPAVWVDSRFATLDYADQAAVSLMAVLSMPSEDISLSLEAGMADLYPMDVIAIIDSKTPASIGGIPKLFFITQTVDTISADKSQFRYSQQIQGRWIV